MKNLSLTTCLLFALAAPALAEPALGTWKTQVDDGAYAHVKMEQCGAAVCGVIARTFDSTGEYKSENLGKKLVIDMKPEGNGRYAGQVWRPSNNKIYIGKMEVSGNSLKLQGCVAGGLLCSSQQWSRLN
jgi:uncharacterized protein (DUF2147 family)